MSEHPGGPPPEPLWGAPQTGAGFSAPASTPKPVGTPFPPWVLAAGALGGLAAVVGAFLTWATGTVTVGGRAFSHSASGLNQDLFGSETLVVGILTLVLTGAMASGRVTGRPVAAGFAGLGVLIVVFAALAFNKISNTQSDTRRRLGGLATGVDTTAGIGLWLTLAAGVLLIAGGLGSVLLTRQGAPAR